MKRLRLFTLSVIVVGAIALAGCGDDDDRNEKELNNKIDQLEREIDSLKQKSSDNAGTNESPEQSGNTEKTSVSGNDT